MCSKCELKSTIFKSAMEYATLLHVHYIFDLQCYMYVVHVCSKYSETLSYNDIFTPQLVSGGKLPAGVS